MLHIRSFFEDSNFDRNAEVWLNSLVQPVDVSIAAPTPTHIVVIARDAESPKDAALLLARGGPALDTPLRYQSFEASGGGGNLLDYTTLTHDNLKLQYVGFSTSTPVSFVLFKDSVQFYRVHTVAGVPWHFPEDVLTRLTIGVLGFPDGDVPDGTRITFNVSDGPCTMQLYWTGGPAQFS